MKLSKSHPRYASLKTRMLLEKGVSNGITSLNGLIAHGRGEAFDYLLGEETHDFAKDAIVIAAALLVSAKYPVISVNGNTAALVPKGLVRLASILDAPLEINLFHKSKKRLRNIKKNLELFGAKNVLLPERSSVISYLSSERKYINSEGIYKADVVFVPLEDGDRAEALIKNGKKVITVDLNPLSRTARSATITIVDNVIRALPLLIASIKEYQSNNKDMLRKTIKRPDNKTLLKRAEDVVRRRQI